MKKFISAFLSMVMVVLMIPVVGVSAETEGLYTYTVTNNKVTITEVDKSISGDVVIPDTLGGYPVSYIGENAFIDCKNLTGITIPNDIFIEEGAFENCTNLSYAILPDSLTKISHQAFYNCSSLQSIVIPDNVT